MQWTVAAWRKQHLNKKRIDLQQAKPQNFGHKKLLVLVAVGVVILCAGVYCFVLRAPAEDTHFTLKFDDVLKKVCRTPKIPLPPYEGVHTFFQFLTNPDVDFCYSWIEFGGEKLPISAQSEEECNDEVRKAKFMCFNDEYQMNLDPCLTYSFGKDLDSQFERDMHLFSCETHAFDVHVEEGEHIKRSQFWHEHRWDIAEFPYDIPPGEKLNPAKGEVDTGTPTLPTLRRSLDFITTMLQHTGREVKFVKSDLVGREWILLKQLITYNHLADFRQIGLRIHLPPKTRTMSREARHEVYSKLYEVLQGLSCIGYRYVLSRPIKYYKGGIRIPEMNRTFYPAYEVNFAKDVTFSPSPDAVN
ncbi:Methyltransferase domain [Trinorchestia longiramus]|nr:Methyltransferase domain [Trinorchestia longiramus]